MDNLFYDKGTLSDNNDWYDNNLPTSIFERLSDCTLLNYSSSKNRFQVTDNITNEHLIIEFKYIPCGVTTDDYFILQFVGKQNAIQFSSIGLSSSVADVKLELNEDKMNIGINNVRKVTDYQLQYPISNGFNFRFGANPNSDGIKVSDIKVYPI